GGFITSLLQGQIELPLLLGAPLAARFDHGQRRLHAKRLKFFQNFFGNDPVDAHPAEGDAPRCRELVEGAHALVAIGLAIADMKFFATPGAAKEAEQQSFTWSHGASAHESLAI